MELIKDLSTLTNIPTVTLNKLVDKSKYCICYDIQENLNSNENITTIDIGIGKINIILDDDNIYYKFIPSKELENSIVQTVVDKKNPLQDVIEDSLRSKITDVYKELF